MFGRGSLYGEIECIMGNGEVPYLGRGRGEGSPYSEVPCWGGGLEEDPCVARSYVG